MSAIDGMSDMNVSSKLKWQDALNTVLQEIESGLFVQGSSFYSLKQLCEKFDFSVITARRVFEELKTQGMLRTNGRQGAVVVGCSKPETVYFALHQEAQGDMVSPGRFMCALMEGFRRPPHDIRFQVTPVALDFCLSHAESFVGKPMIVLQSALFEVSENKSRLNQALAKKVLATFNPIVFQTCLAIPGYTEIGIDMDAGIRETVDLLASLGHQRIAFFSGDVSALWFRSRFRGYLNAIEEHGLSFDPTLLAITNQADEDVAALERMLTLATPPTAVVCTNDTRALNVLAACRQRGLRVPEDLAVVGFGDFPESSLSIPPLTTHDPRDADMGAAVLDLVDKRRMGKLDEPKQILIRPKLIQRASHEKPI